MLTKEELIEIGVITDNLVYPNGEKNIIVQSFNFSEEQINEGCNMIMPDIYQPRKNMVYSCGCIGDYLPFETNEDKEDYIKHLRDSAERLKIMSYYLSKQADEIEECGYPKTSLYYAE